ncbi:hypothetical protein [Escherichia coli]|uniref:hypothetical protein n=1 Tax=Escherichia coli TaxID=562 RepID=UPI0013D7E506|nr:hypothetical protein [Escherichia coli]MDY9503182.1 hypothetical protein [Escherichia coli]NGK52333.1 hypothetical protein [Escherichia coli]HBD5441606.1 hypothetical protein [Escherichia coli]HCQ3817661.1 hypothetical protein [Escherichia coli]HEB2125787.1 hypothetical protein [Escherichia coli]
MSYNYLDKKFDELTIDEQSAYAFLNSIETNYSDIKSLRKLVHPDYVSGYKIVVVKSTEESWLNPNELRYPFTEIAVIDKVRKTLAFYCVIFDIKEGVNPVTWRNGRRCYSEELPDIGSHCIDYCLSLGDVCVSPYNKVDGNHVWLGHLRRLMHEGHSAYLLYEDGTKQRLNIHSQPIENYKESNKCLIVIKQ